MSDDLPKAPRMTPDKWWEHRNVVMPNGQVVTDWQWLEYIAWCQQIDAGNRANGTLTDEVRACTFP